MQRIHLHITERGIRGVRLINNKEMTSKYEMLREQ
jgi:hypothetical protein